MLAINHRPLGVWLLALVASLLMLTACGTTTGGPRPTVTSSPTITPTASVRRAMVLEFHTGPVDVVPRTPTTKSVACPAGTTRVGGGYNVEATPPDYGADVSAPEGSAGWTVTLRNGLSTSGRLTVYVTCLQANFPVSAQVVQNSDGPTDSSAEATATCPAGTTVSGGGFSSDVGSFGSAARPDGNGWHVKANAPGGRSLSATAYAICVGAPLQLSGLPSQNTVLQEGQNGSTSVMCRADELATAGGTSFGFGSTDGGIVFTEVAPLTLAARVTGWQVAATDIFVAPYTLSAYGVCLSDQALAPLALGERTLHGHCASGDFPRFDFDTGSDQSSTPDVIWGDSCVSPDGAHQVRPNTGNGAHIVLVAPSGGQSGFDGLTSTQLRALSFQDGEFGVTDGDVFAVRTSDTHYAKVLVEHEDFTPSASDAVAYRFRFVTYP